ncbi:MAG: hypothetical protein LBT39_01885 [Treponema sp.]|jgi:hypothetical protein|nr:hypothetical protein [Treponema sp.]
MQENFPLDSCLEDYYQGTLERKKFEGLIFEHIQDNAKRFNLQNWDDDDRTDFLCWLYPRIQRAIDKYHYGGSTFDAYISGMVRWAAREYLSTETAHIITEQTYWDGMASDMAVYSQEPEYGSDDPLPEKKRPFRMVDNPRQALLLLLKSYFYVSDDFINRAAPAMGIKKETLNRLVGEMRSIRSTRDEEIRELQLRIYSQYYRCRAFEKRMNAAVKDSGRYFMMKKRLERAEKRLTAMRKRFRLLRTDPSNRQVARVLGVPKGTVDSGLFAIKARFDSENGEDPAALLVLKN